MCIMFVIFRPCFLVRSCYICVADSLQVSTAMLYSAAAFSFRIFVQPHRWQNSSVLTIFSEYFHKPEFHQQKFLAGFKKKKGIKRPQGVKLFLNCCTRWTGRYLQCFDMRGVCRSHIEALHEGLEHPLFNGRSYLRYQATCVNATRCYCPAVHEHTHLPLNGHRGYILKHDVLHLSARRRQKITTTADSGGGKRADAGYCFSGVTYGSSAAEPATSWRCWLRALGPNASRAERRTSPPETHQNSQKFNGFNLFLCFFIALKSTL